MQAKNELLVPVGLLIGLLLVFTGSLATDGGEPAEREQTAQLRTVHTDPAALMQRAMETTRAFLSEDPAAIRAALDALKELTPPLDREQDEPYGNEIIHLDQAFHVTIDRSRELISTGRMADAFDQYVWVQRACVQCHGLARAAGWLPATPATGAGH